MFFRKKGQLTVDEGTPTQLTEKQVSPPIYLLVAMGGTFDVLHRGHRLLLKKAFEVGRTVTIGVTSDVFAPSFINRTKSICSNLGRRTLKKLLEKWGVLSRARIVKLDDRFGPTIASPRIQALVVSKRTVRTGYEINRRRRLKGLKPLAIVTIDLIQAQDKKPISSTRIRRGRIDREGRVVRGR